ncbi:hypothetical protein BDN70DRAFT_881467 [Pholiota conissans]|uniref:F-box domain-containing protein n=1 Tax=Pholiota conissans TaxID=109636 RepID=A0A9P5YY25_9AGAR|nr:hypothetical protein BDN70DRAFT_881467 [Pholiota conissans]
MTDLRIRFDEDCCHLRAKSHPCVPCNEATCFNEEILQVERGSLALEARRVTISTRMNDVHDPLVSVLPVEIISNIFEEFVADGMEESFDYPVSMDIEKTPLVLGAVCRSWRAIAWASPRLWNAISVNLYNGNPGLADIVSEWLARSKELPLFVHVYSQRWRSKYMIGPILYPPRGYEPDATALRNAINAHSERWASLDLQVPKQYMLLFNDTAKPRSLKDLTLSIDFGEVVDPGKITFAEDSPVERLSIKHMRTSKISIDWASLVYFQAEELTAEACYHLLSCAPMLQHCKVENMQNTTAPFEGKILRHGCLTHLESSSSHIGEVIAHLESPALTCLEVNGVFGPDITILVDFLVRASGSGGRRDIQVKISDRMPEYSQEVLVALRDMRGLEVMGSAITFRCVELYCIHLLLSLPHNISYQLLYFMVFSAALVNSLHQIFRLQRATLLEQFRLFYPSFYRRIVFCSCAVLWLKPSQKHPKIGQ